MKKPIFGRLDPSHYLKMGVHTYRGKFIVQLSFWVAAISVGIAAILFTRASLFMQREYELVFELHPYLILLLTPIGFLLAAGVVRFSPMAGGSGVPQALYAAMLARDEHDGVSGAASAGTQAIQEQLVSIKTAVVKVISTLLGFLCGASIGIEGPMVQISTAIFAAFGKKAKKLFPQLDFQSYLVAGAGTGIAAAFNAPLGGIAFALEEVAAGDFGSLRHMVLIAIIVCGLTAQALIGNKLYFGNVMLGPISEGFNKSFVGWAVLIGIVGGILGGIFGRLVTNDRLRNIHVKWWMRALIFGGIVAILGFIYSGQTGETNYTATRAFFEGEAVNRAISFPVAKLLATAFSTLAGIGGGILAPSLVVGSWLGISIAKIAFFANLKVCALLGMVAYFSGAFQIPITAVIIVMEITNQHEVIFPMMIAALCAFIVARMIMPTSLYHLLIERTFQNGSLAASGPEGEASSSKARPKAKE